MNASKAQIDELSQRANSKRVATGGGLATWESGGGGGTGDAGGGDGLLDSEQFELARELRAAKAGCVGG